MDGHFPEQSEKIASYPNMETLLLLPTFESSDDFTGDTMNPVAYRLANGTYTFNYWDAQRTWTGLSPNMIFQQSAIKTIPCLQMK
jgi:hypothetical protein